MVIQSILLNSGEQQASWHSSKYSAAGIAHGTITSSNAHCPLGQLWPPFLLAHGGVTSSNGHCRLGHLWPPGCAHWQQQPDRLIIWANHLACNSGTFRSEVKFIMLTGDIRWRSQAARWHKLAHLQVHIAAGSIVAS